MKIVLLPLAQVELDEAFLWYEAQVFDKYLQQLISLDYFSF